MDPRCIQWITTHIFLLLFVGDRIVQGARILMVPYPMGSHIHMFSIIGEGLIDKGHHVYATASPKFPDLENYRKGRMQYLIYEATEKEFYELAFDAMPEQYISEISLREDLRTNYDGVNEMCSNPLSDQKFFQELKSLNFDLAVVDSFPGYRCMLVLMHRLGLPYVSSETLHEHSLYRNPMIPSVFPSNFATVPKTEKMTFWERMENTWAVFDWASDTRVAYLEDTFLEEFFYETDPVPINRLAAKSLLWLIDHTPILDYPRPKMPNEIYIGGITTKPAKPLPSDLEEFASSNPNGFILVSFGSLSMVLPPKTITTLLDTFSQIKYNVIMRFPLDPPADVPSNVKLMSWMPQNDLLAHPNIKVFVSHCGASGQNEGLYHGVPIIGLPMFGDQPYNAKRLVYHGYGQYLKLLTLTTTQLVTAINEVVSNTTYKANIQRASEIFRDDPMTALDTATYWIEHVLKYGGAHLHSHALDMPWAEYLMLDILFFIIFVVIFGLIMIYCIARQLLKLVCTSSSKQRHPTYKKD